jgi:hypothetical protein
MKKLAALIALAAAAISPAAADAQSRHTVVRTVVLQTTDGFSTTGTLAAGTIFGGTGLLRQGGVSVGTYSSICIASSTTRAQCNATLIWRGRGRVQLAGSISITETTNRVSIVGGTGKYRGARGEASIRRASDDGSRQRVKLRLVE